MEQLSRSLQLKRTHSQTDLPIGKIVPNPKQPRKHLSRAKLDELVLSIRKRGVLTPVRVRELKGNEGYEIIAGERRWRAATEAGLKEIPAIIVHDQAPEQAQVDAYLDNVLREDLNAVDRATALVQLRVNLGSHSWDEVAKQIGLTRRRIYHLLGLASLPENVKDDIRAGILSEKHGRALRLLNHDHNSFEYALNQIREKKLSGEEALSLTRELRKGRSAKKRHTFTVTYHTEDELIAALESRLRDLKGMRSDTPG